MSSTVASANTQALRPQVVRAAAGQKAHNTVRLDSSCNSLSNPYLGRRALKVQKFGHCGRQRQLAVGEQAASGAQAAPFRRRGRKYTDSLLDNVDSKQTGGQRERQQPLRNQSLAQPERQPKRSSVFTSSSPSSDSSVARQPSSVTEPSSASNGSNVTEPSNTTGNGVGWGENAAPDDWGWGFDNPNIAVATGSFKDDSQGARNGTQSDMASQHGNTEQPATASEDSNPNAPQPDEDWDDQQPDDADDPADRSPDVTALSRREADQLLKLYPQSQQIKYYSGAAVDLGVRLGTGLVATIATSKIPLLASLTLSYPLWWPVYQAFWQNQKLRSQYRYVGFWQTSVLSVTLQQQPGFQNRDTSQPTVSFLFGDESSARTQVDVPYNDRYQDVYKGESAELLLLSNTPDFSSFKALKEAYLPESGIWIAKYPFLDRDVFLDISLDIARERQSEQPAQWPS